jgi:pimeloyl-ACP methyl ester carboxylesterase
MRIAYLRGGSGPPAILIHGVGGDSSNWDPIAERLRQRYDVIAMDLRGHGKSDRIVGPVDVHDFVRDAVQVLDETGIDKCRVAGFSLGGAVALAMALDFPLRVEKLAVIGTVCGRTPEEEARALERVEFLKQHGIAGIAEANRERWFSDEFRSLQPDVVERRVAQVKACDPTSYLQAFTLFCTVDFADCLDDIRVPALIITGEHDIAATPRMARLMGERIRNSQVHVLPNLRHSLLIEAPEQVARLLQAFM